MSHTALQIVSVDLKSNEVTVNKENLETIKKNLKECGAEKISVVSVMGAYRTGKSFLLDLMLRYLENSTPEEQVKDNTIDFPREDGAPFPQPSWLKSGGNLSEAAAGEESKSDTTGFTWRGGQAKCTEGIWMWSKPYVRTITVTENVSKSEDEEVYVKRKVKCGLLLMDTQGAFDSQTTKQQSATIFGLTTALSSKQIYNIQGRIGADIVEHLHYFAEMAVAASRAGQTNSPTDALGNAKNIQKPFQHLELLVRDWSNFDDETWEDEANRKLYGVPEQASYPKKWTVDACCKQMDMHFDQHFGDEVREREAVDTLKDMFGNLGVYLFPAPGTMVQESRKKRWDGNLNDIDDDFVRFLDLFNKKTFNHVATQKIQGQDLSPDSFVGVVEALVQAFSGMEVTQLSMVEAIGKAKNLVSKDDAEKMYKKYMDKIMNDKLAKTGKAPEELKKESDKAISMAIELYDRSATFGNEEEIKNSKVALQQELESIWLIYEKENDRRMEKALTAFATMACLAVAIFIVDKISDYTCDWWSDTCVQMSKIAVLIYSTIAVLICYQTYLVFNTRGRTAAGVASIELFKEMAIKSSEGWEKLMWYAQNIEVAKKDAKELWGKCAVHIANFINMVMPEGGHDQFASEKKNEGGSVEMTEKTGSSSSPNEKADIKNKASPAKSGSGSPGGVRNRKKAFD